MERFAELLIPLPPEVLSHLATFKVADSLAKVLFIDPSFYKSFVQIFGLRSEQPVVHYAIQSAHLAYNLSS